MSDEVFLSGLDGRETKSKLAQLLSESDAESLFFASAYVTQGGVSRIKTILEENQIETCVAVFGLDGTVTQPNAIESAIESDWILRLIEGGDSHFHPKIALAGGPPPEPFSDVRGGYIGSANFTKGGLVSNIEAGLIVQDDTIIRDLQNISEEIWELAEPAENVDLETYADRYAKGARKRGTDYQPAGVGASVTDEVDSGGDATPPEKPTYDYEHATVAWVGLESFTGEYKFQVEFPRKPAEVIKDILGTDETEVSVRCSDGTVRVMEYKFYDDNSMFRLNIPNDVPGVEQAREEESGLAVVKENDEGGIPIELEILNDETEVQEFVQRSKREGAWDETRTRLYGWL